MKLIFRLYPLWIFTIVTIFIFRDFIFRGLLPIPADILTGVYYPWLDYKWGTIAGVPVKNPLPSDVISILFPWRNLAFNYLRSGILPLWDPTILLGTPLLANFQTAIFNPINVLFFILPNQLAWSLQVFIQPIFIASSMFLLLRLNGLNKFASIIGGLGFAYSGFSIVWMEYNTIGYCLAFLPLIFYVSQKLATSISINTFLALAVCVCLQIFSGYPQICIYTIFFSTLWFSYFLFDQKQNIKSKLILYFLAIFFGVVMSSIQTLPGLEMIQNSIRDIDKTSLSSNRQFLGWDHLITLIEPDFFGNPATGNYRSTGFYDNQAFYVSIVIVFFAFIGLNRLRSDPKIKVLFSFALFALILSTPNPIGIFVLDNISIFKGAVSTRALMIFDFSLIFIAAIALSNLHKIRPAISNIYPLSTIVGIFVGLIFCHFYLLRTSPKLIDDLSKIVTAERNLILPLTLCIILTGISWLQQRRLIFLIVFVILVVDVNFSAQKYLSFSTPNFLYPQTKVTDFLQQNLQGARFDREAAQLLTSNTWSPYMINSIDGQNPLYPRVESEYFSLIDHRSELIGRFVDIDNFDSKLYDTLNVKYMLVLNRDPLTGIPDNKGRPFDKYTHPRFKLVKKIGAISILENTQNSGLAWMPEDVVCLTNPEESRKFLLQENRIIKNSIVINCDSSFKQSGYVQILSQQPTEIIVKTDSETGGYVVFSTSLYPGWNAYINNLPTQQFIANSALIAVKSPPGTNIISLKYQPKSLYIGFIVSIVSFVMIFLIWIISKKNYFKILSSIQRILR